MTSSTLKHLLWKTCYQCAFAIVSLVHVNRAFLPPTSISRRRSTFASDTRVLKDPEAEFVESMIVGERYSMIPLPDSMLSTTLFVGNLCEFVQDGDLSNLFQTVSILHSLPSCVVRKPNMQSLHYGFVAFPTIAEKEAALLRFHGLEWRGKELRVQPVVDHPKKGRVRVPERLVVYVSGEEKKTRSGKANTLRQNSREEKSPHQEKSQKKKKGAKRGRLPARLTEKEWEDMERAGKRGFLTLIGGGGRAGKSSQLKNVHREWCDDREKPQIIHYKAFGGRAAVDRVLVELSPLRRSHSSSHDFVLDKCKAEVLSEAASLEMELCSDFCQDNSLEGMDDEGYYLKADEANNREAWENTDDDTVGIFEGERAKAKAMAKALASLWDIPEKEKKLGGSQHDGAEKKRNNDKRKGLRQHRKRGGGHRQAW